MMTTREANMAHSKGSKAIKRRPGLLRLRLRLREAPAMRGRDVGDLRLQFLLGAGPLRPFDSDEA
jgi:hypothetical protein